VLFFDNFEEFGHGSELRDPERVLPDKLPANNNPAPPPAISIITSIDNGERLSINSWLSSVAQASIKISNISRVTGLAGLLYRKITTSSAKRAKWATLVISVISGLLSSQNHRNISHHFHRCKTSHYSS
jgi:hypothetical protein